MASNPHLVVTDHEDVSPFIFTLLAQLLQAKVEYDDDRLMYMTLTTKAGKTVLIRSIL